MSAFSDENRMFQNYIAHLAHEKYDIHYSYNIISLQTKNYIFIINFLSYKYCNLCQFLILEYENKSIFYLLVVSGCNYGSGVFFFNSKNCHYLKRVDNDNFLK